MKTTRPERRHGTLRMQRALMKLAMIFVVLSVNSSTIFGSESLIPSGAVWRYLDDGSNQGTLWRQPGFNDAAWPSGLAQLGFGDGDERTILRIAPDVSQRAVTFYFRHLFNVAQPGTISNLIVRLLRDDGGVVYLNGVEVFRSNMPEGPISYTTLAALNVGGADETTNFYSAPVDSRLLVQGVNVVAVEIHQVNLTSGDISFDLELRAEGIVTNTMPIVTVLAPDNSASESDPNSERPSDPGLFRIVRSGPTNEALHISYALSGTASNSVDYAALPGFVDIPAGVESVDIQVDALDDSEVEGTETIRLSLLLIPCANSSSPGPGCYIVGSPREATISILDTDTPPNRPPTVSLTSPQEGAEFNAPANITLIANGDDPDGYLTLHTVEFFEGTHSLGIRTNEPVLNPIGPFVLGWQDVVPGQYTLTAVATDDHGATGTSAPVHITVRGPSVGRVTLVSTGAVWKYLDNGTDQGENWRGSDFNDDSWAAGPAQLGYGDGDEQTVVSYGPNAMNKYITTYFRHAFEISDTAGLSNVILRVLRDDGVVIYLNGHEVYRNNMPAGPIAFNTLASSVAPNENDYLVAAIPPSALINGRNVVAAEVHQANPASSDLGFDLELVGNGDNPPPSDLPIVNVIATTPNASEGSFNSEGLSGAFTFYRSGSLDSALTVTFALGGSASNGIDYAFLSNRVTFAQGAAETRLIVFPRFDNIPEPTETVVVILASPVCVAMVPPPPGCYSVGSSSQATVFIADAPSGTNRAPTVTIVTPHEGDTFSPGSNILLGANATDDGQVAGLEFFANGTKIGDAQGPLTTPAGAWLLTWSNVVAGDYSLTARARDNAGATGTAGPIHIQVKSSNETNITLIASGSVWKYSDEGVDLGEAWRGLAYDDSSWSSGLAQLGYGDGDEQTVVSYGPDPMNKYITTYFRRTFFTPNATNIASLRARLLQDDGSVVYLNGTEVFRSNMPFGPIPFNTLASMAVENQIVEFSISPQLLRPGDNVVAVEIHQVSPNSTDISFDLQLVGSVGPRPEPTNQPPFVQLNAPRDGDVFISPTNIELVAYAQDDHDGYDVTVEFFAGTQSLGFGTFVPTRCATPYCPSFALTLSNALPGNYRLTARATDQSGASSISAPVNITVRGELPADRELHVVGIYSGTTSSGGLSHNHELSDTAVFVNRPGKGVTLFLGSYEPVLWHVSASEGTVIEKVILSGYYRQQVTGLVPGVEVVSLSYEEHTEYISVGYSLDSGRFYEALPRICAMTGMEISSFHGNYQGPFPAPFVIDAVQDDERLHCNYPQPTPASELPNLSFRLSFYDGGIPGSGRVFFQNYTLAGATNNGRLLPAPRVVADDGGIFYYGAERQEVFKIDSQTGMTELMNLGPELPELSWPMGIAFDSQRVLLATLGGEGFLYGYAPDLAQWSLVSSMNNRDVDCLVYHTSGDALYAVAVSHSDYGNPVVYEFSPDGVFRREIRLPVLPFNIGPIGYHSELVSVGDYLVLLLEPDPLYWSSYEPQESRIYLIDPRTSQVWLTYRRVSPPTNPAHDSDGDGVTDNHDRCPNTPSGAVVNGDGCSITQLCPCDGSWRTNATYVQCVIDRSWQFYREGLITAEQRRAIIGEAAQRDCAANTVSEETCLFVQPQRSDEIQRDGLCFVVGGVSGTCVLECSTNMVNWIPIQWVTMPTLSMEVTDPAAGRDGARFYRLRYER